jgi:hypothetical protein
MTSPARTTPLRSARALLAALGICLVGCAGDSQLTSAEQQWHELGSGTWEPQWPIEVLSGGHKLIAIREQRQRRGDNPASADLVTQQIEWGWRAVMRNNGQVGGTLYLTYEVLDPDSFVVSTSDVTQFLHPGNTVSVRGNGFVPIEDRKRLRQGNLRANWISAYGMTDTTMMSLDTVLY